jgi:hypothetical protein
MWAILGPRPPGRRAIFWHTLQWPTMAVDAAGTTMGDGAWRRSNPAFLTYRPQYRRDYEPPVARGAKLRFD